MVIYAGLEDRVHVTDVGNGSSPRDELVGHDIECVLASPATAERVYVGTAHSGLHRSTDGGETWSVVGGFHDRDERVTSLTVSPHDEETVFAGTEPSRVYRSRNAGRSWTALSDLGSLPSSDRWSFPPRPETHHVRCLGVAPHDPETLYVGIEAGAFVRSIDGGETWLDHPAGGPRDPHTLAAHPDAPERVYVAAGDGYHVSDDGGGTWDRPAEGLRHGYVWGLAVDPGHPDTVVVSAATGARRAHTPDRARSVVYRRSGDGPWERAMDGLGDADGLLRAVLATDGTPGRFYALTNRGYFRSDDAAETWTPLDGDGYADRVTGTPEALAVV